MNHNDIPTGLLNLKIRAQLHEQALRLNQRARYPDDWHPHEWYMKRVRLFAWLAAIGLVGAVAWMVAGP